MDNIIFMSELDEHLNTIFDKTNTASNFSSNVFIYSSNLNNYFKNLEIQLYPSKANVLYTESKQITNFIPKYNGAINFLTISSVSDSYVTVQVKKNNEVIYIEEFYSNSNCSNWNTFSVPVEAGTKYQIIGTNSRKIESFTIYGIYT